MKIMKIAIITQSYLPIHGGVAEHVHHSYLELKKRGHEVTIITTFFNKGDENFSNEDVIRIGRDLTLPVNKAFCNITVGYKLNDKLREIEKEKKFDIIHIHSPLDPVLPLIALKVMKAPKVGTFHSYMKTSIGYEVFGDVLRKEYLPLLAGRIVVSPAAKEFITQYFPFDYRLIPNGVDLTRFNPEVKPIEKFDDGFFNILFVGRLDPRKGLKYLLKAFPLIHQQYPKSRLIVVGGGFLKEYYRIFLNNGLREKVSFEGFVSAEALPRYYAGADIYCSPATGAESFGIVLLEAMASAKAIVASDIKGYQGLITDGEEGLLVEPEEPTRLAEAILKLIRDKKQRERMGKKGLAKVKKYSWIKVVDQLEAYYREILKKKAK